MDSTKPRYSVILVHKIQSLCETVSVIIFLRMNLLDVFTVVNHFDVGAAVLIYRLYFWLLFCFD